jgi:hypothetical protein
VCGVLIEGFEWLFSLEWSVLLLLQWALGTAPHAIGAASVMYRAFVVDKFFKRQFAVKTTHIQTAFPDFEFHLTTLF